MSDRDEIYYDLSASRLKTHASCPEKYRQKYVLGREGTKGKKGYGEMGSWVHQTIENVLEDYGGPLDKHALHSKFQQEFHRLGETDEIDKTVIDDDQREVAGNALEVAGRYIASQEPMIRSIEQPVNFHIENPQIDRTVFGKVDVVTEGDQIWDWKTGSINEEYTPRDELLQGSIYMAGFHNEYDRLPSAIKFVYLKEEKVREVEPNEDSWQDMVQYARRLVQDEKSDNFEAKPESGKCFWCDYEMFCSASEVGVGGVNELIKHQPSAWDIV